MCVRKGREEREVGEEKTEDGKGDCVQMGKVNEGMGRGVEGTHSVGKGKEHM